MRLIDADELCEKCPYHGERVVCSSCRIGNAPEIDAVGRMVLEQYIWEKTILEMQLNDLGFQFGEEVKANGSVL